MTALLPERVSYPTAPVAEPLDGTLLSIVTPQEGTANLGDGSGLFETFNCLETGIVPGNICGPVSGSKFDDADGPTWIDGFAFAAYGVAVCKLVDPATLRDGTERAFTAAESRVVEQALMEDVFAANPGHWAAAEDLTPTAGAVDPVVGQGILESHASRYYAGKGVLHMPRVVATMLLQQGALEMEGARLETGLGTPTAAGAGYDLPNLGPDGTEPAEGEKWVYATGQVLLLRKRLPTREVFNQNVNAGGIEPNDSLVLAESAYIVSVDCYKSAVRVKIY